MKKLIFGIFSILLLQHAMTHSQTVYPHLITPLPPVLIESSGVEVNNANSVWTHNDSGDSARIFNIDTLGNLLRTLYLHIDTAIDWEEVTQDDQGNYYIGDFGNNLNNRTDLKIYKIPNPDSITGDTVVPQFINFTYSDQLLFPPDSAHRNFDCEAMFHFNDSLYLFSKNRGTSTYCRMHRLPDQAGIYIAELVDSFDTGHWITSADISPSGKAMTLLSETRIWLFKGFTNAGFFGGSAQELSMATISQKEAIVFVNDSIVYITDEKFLNTGGNLYSLNLGDWINSVDEFPAVDNSVNLYPNPTNEIFIIETPQKSTIEILNIQGQLIKTIAVSGSKTNIDLSALPCGVYVVEVKTEKGMAVKKFVKD